MVDASARWKMAVVSLGLYAACVPDAYTIGSDGQRYEGTRNDGAYSSGGMAEARAQRARRAEAAQYTGGRATSSSASRQSAGCSGVGAPDATRGIALAFATLSDAIVGPRPDATVVTDSTPTGSTTSVYVHDSRSSVEQMQARWSADDVAARQYQAECERDVAARDARRAQDAAARDVQRTLASADALQSKLQCVVTAATDLRAPGESVADVAARGQLLLSQWALERSRLDAAGRDVSDRSSESGRAGSNIARTRMAEALAGLQRLARGAAVQLGQAMDARRASVRAGAPVPSGRNAYRALRMCLSNPALPESADRRIVVGEIGHLRERAAACNAEPISLSVTVDGETGVPLQVRSPAGPVPRCIVDATKAMQLLPVDRDTWVFEFPLALGTSGR